MAVNAKVASAYVDLVARTEAFEKALGEASGYVRRFNQEARANMHEARGSIALLGEEVGMRLPRHLQAFLAGLPGVAPALSAAFSGVAVLALVGFVFEAGKKVHEFAQKNEEAAKKNSEAWAAAAKDVTGINSELDISNSKLDDAIAKLQKKPGSNAIRTALLEASAEADKLGEKLDKDLSKLSDIKTAPGGLAGLASLLGGGPTAVDQAAATAARQLQNVIDEYNSVLARAAERGDTANYNQIRNDQLSRIAGDPVINQSLATISEYLRANQNLAGQHDQKFDQASSAYAILSGAVRALNQQQTEELGKQQQSTLQASNDSEHKLLAQLEENLKTSERVNGKSVTQEYLYWAEILRTHNRGSDEFLNAVNEKAASAAAAFDKQWGDKGKLAGIRRSTMETSGPVLRLDGGDQQRGADQLTAAIARQAEVLAMLNGRWREASDRQAVAVGAMTEHAAAIDIADAHTKAFEASMQALNDELQKLEDEQAFALTIGAEPDKQNLARQTQVRTQISVLGNQHAIEQMQDAMRITDTTWKGMIDSVFDELAYKANETQQQVRQIIVHTIDSINTELARGMIGGKMDFAKIFENAGQSLAKTGLEKVEGMLFGRHGKADGYHVHVDNLPDNPAAGVAGGSSVVGGSLGKSLGGSLMGMLNDSDFFGNLFGGRVFGAGGIFGGGHALGGDVAAGVPIDVGELGPERFTPMVPGRITSSRDLGGGSTLYVDARGTDPALSKANFERALRQTHAQSVGDAARLMADHQMRKPH
jgi:hypothetical protein